MPGALGYDPRRRPPQPPTPAPDAFAVHFAEVADGVQLAYVHEGVGGTPLLLLHGYPETKRIWWRNIAPLAAAGFEVIAPDFRGMGDSTHPPDDQHDPATYARDMEALVRGHLGHATCLVAGGDVGGVVATDLVHRFPGFVSGLCAFNTVPPMTAAGYAPAGLDFRTFSAGRGGPTADYQELQGNRPDQLAAMLGNDDARRQWVAAMYTSRLWASPGSFTEDELAFMTAPFADEARLRAGWAIYQLSYGRAFRELPLTAAVDVPTLLLYGPDDHVIESDFLHFAEAAYTRRTGPLVVPGAGHFLMWERADVFNALLPAVLLSPAFGSTAP